MSDDRRVVALPGFSVPQHQDEPVADVVEIVEELLVLAKTGALRGLGAALVLKGPQLVTETRLFSGPSPDRYCLVAAVAQLRHMTDLSAWPNMATEVEPNAS